MGELRAHFRPEFLNRVDAGDGRGRVLYLRHDGDYGLVQPSDHR